MTMPVRSKVRRSVLRFGGTAPNLTDGTAFEGTVSSIVVTPSSDKDGDDLEMASGTTLYAPREVGFTLHGGGIQTFDDPAGFQAFCYAHNGEAMPFYFKPNDTSAVVYTGTVVVVALEEGGDAGTNPGDMSFEFDGVGFYTRTPPGSQILPSIGTAGSPGSWSGKIPPLVATAMAAPTSYIPSPTTNWTTGQSVRDAANSPMNWNGTAWVAGVHA